MPRNRVTIAILLYHKELPMATVTLRRWGGAVAVSLPKKVLALLALDAGSQVSIAVEDGKLVLAPAARPTLERLLAEQRKLDRKSSRIPRDQAWLAGRIHGREKM